MSVTVKVNADAASNALVIKENGQAEVVVGPGEKSFPVTGANQLNTFRVINQPK